MKAKKPLRDRWLTIRLSKEEESTLLKLSRKTTCQSLSEYGRSVLLREPVIVQYRNVSADDFLEEMVLLKKELNAIGNNFNQAVHRLHTLDKTEEIKLWLLMSESGRSALLKKTEEILQKVSQIHAVWLQKITVPSSIRRALNYNEQKVVQGKAECLLVSGFLKEANDLNFYEKLSRFEALIQLNDRASTNTVHISLNFAEGEKLAEEKLKGIASLYMEKIGFGGQPFLMYENRDAGHPHLHIVTTNIQWDGSRISLHNLGRDAPEKVRKELEVQFGSTRAGEKKTDILNTEPLLTLKAVYGKLPTIQAITNMLNAVLLHSNTLYFWSLTPS